MHFPKAPVASLAELFNTFASNAHLYKVGKQLGLQDFIRWRPRDVAETEEGKKDEATGFVKVWEDALVKCDSNFIVKAVADTVEALIGGIYVEKVFDE